MAQELLDLSLRMKITLHRLFLTFVALAPLSIGCSGSPSTSSLPTSPSSIDAMPVVTSDQLAGTWTLVSIEPAGQTQQPAPAGATYTLTLGEGRLSTRVDCNSCSGGFALSGQTLTAGPAFACTRAACPTMAFENTFTRILSGDSTVALSGNTLVLTSQRGVLRFVRQ
jgi:heat shock protein HslJ